MSYEQRIEHEKTGSAEEKKGIVIYLNTTFSVVNKGIS